MKEKTEAKVGDAVKCVSRGGYMSMKEGESGILVKVTPKCYDPDSRSGFTWTEYWSVKTANGHTVHGHTYRFEVVKEDERLHQSNVQRHTELSTDKEIS